MRQIHCKRADGKADHQAESEAHAAIPIKLPAFNARWRSR
jgi:hypothetical protein